MTQITVSALIEASLEKVWKYWTTPKHIMEWNNASDDWFTPSAENDLKVGEKFTYRMSARDESVAFDFSGTYDEIEEMKRIKYTLDDERKVEITFELEDDLVKVTEIFEAEIYNSPELQEAGWQAILDNFKRYTENF